jgi:flagellar protein FlaG
MEAVGAVKAQEVSGPEKVLNISDVRTQTDAKPAEKKDFHEKDKAEKISSTEKDEDRIESTAAAMEKFVSEIQRELKIEIHKETGRIMVKVISKETGDVIREIPSEELMELASKMEEMTGVLYNRSA